MNNTHLIDTYLDPTKKKFVESFKPLGFDPALVESIVEEGISTYSFNLMTQMIALHQKAEQRK
jgi:hypothetical protein